MWGPGNVVETPHIDQLANDGAIFTNFYTPAPVCTPSRASFMSGLYAKKTGAHRNIKGRMRTGSKTWSHYLNLQKYQTHYLGKWHLDGEEFIPGVFSTMSARERRTRKFGFKNNFYRFNHGHYKFLDVKNKTLQLYSYNEDFGDKDKANGIKEHYTTDYLFENARRAIQKSLHKSEEPFALMLSIPDPHSPNKVRPPYDTMYDNMDFKIPSSMTSRYRGFHSYPEFANNTNTGADLKNDVFRNSLPMMSKEDMLNFEKEDEFPNHMRRYFGMVKCIDDNLGNLMRFIKDQGIEENTIVVFTSDHGDLLFEHGKTNKGLPYKTSLGVPFIIKYPKKILPGKVVETARSHIDFAPTILSLMGVEHDNDENSFDGADFSEDVLNKESVVNDESKIVFASHRGWIAAVSSRFKLILGKASLNLVPWLFDMKNDARELVNYYGKAQYADAKDILLKNLFQELNDNKKYFPAQKSIWYWNSNPVCLDSREKIFISRKYVPSYCSDLGMDVPISKCSRAKVRRRCRDSCNTCCHDSKGKVLFNHTLYGCEELEDKCNLDEVKVFCPVTCGYGKCASTEVI